MFTRDSNRIATAFALFGVFCPTVFSAAQLLQFELSEVADAIFGVIQWLLWPTWLIINIGLAPADGPTLSTPILVVIVLTTNGAFWLGVGIAFVKSRTMTLLGRWLSPITTYFLLAVSFNFLLLCYFEKCPPY